MKISPLTKEAIDFSFNNLSEISMNDSKVFNESVEEMKGRFEGAMGGPFAMSFYNNEMECCAIFNAELIGLCEWRIYFADVKNKLKDISVPFTMFFKRISDEIVQKHGGSLKIFSAFSEGKPRRWFELMGFVYEGTNGKVSKYVKER